MKPKMSMMKGGMEMRMDGYWGSEFTDTRRFLSIEPVE